VDDDPVIREVLRLGLELEGFQILEAEDKEALFRLIATHRCDLITLDLNLGPDEGLLLAREVRSRLNVPIIMITARHKPDDRVTGLEHGADDYITKPFHVREVVLRARTVLDRYARTSQSSPESRAQRFAFYGLVLDTASKELRSQAGALIELTETEFQLIEHFVRNRARVMSRDELWQLLRGREWSPLDRTLDGHIARLRRKIESSLEEEPRVIKSVRGVGYVFAAGVQEI
jgi:DNA-binding response OmpR family regulator